MGDYRVGGTGGTQGVYKVGDQAKIEGQLDLTRIGAGSFDPDVSSIASALGLHLPEEMSNDDLIILMQTLKSKLEDTQIKTSSETVQQQKAERKSAADERIDKLMEVINKKDEASKGGEIGKIFGWIAAAAMVIAGAILIATGVGTAAGVGLMIGGVAMLAVMALQESGGMEKMLDGMAKGLAPMFEAFGMDKDEAKKAARITATAIVAVVITAVAVAAGIAAGPAVGVMVGAQFMGLLFSPENLEAMGVDKEAAPWVSMGISIGLALASISVGVGTSVAASKGIEMAGKLGPKLAEYGTRFSGMIAEKTGSTVMQVQKVAQVSSYVMQGVQGAATVGGAAAGIKGAVATRDAAEAEAKSKELEADLLKLQQMLQGETDRIDEIIKRLQEGTNIVIDVLNQSAAVQHKIASV